MKIEKFGFEIVQGCQLRCVGCPNSTLKPKIKPVELDTFRAVLANVDVDEVKLLRLFNFGEPLLHPDVPSLLRLIPQQKFTVRLVEISTNAQHHDFDMLAEIFRTRVLGRLVVSCDGNGTPEEYERYRPPGKWERLMAFLAKASELRDRHSPGTKLMTRTICETDEGRRRWASVLEPLGWSPEFRSWLNLPGSRELPSGRETKAVHGLCEYMQFRTLYVDYDGTVVTCCVHPRAGVFGNLVEERYTEIFRGAKRRNFIAKMKSDRQAMPICGQCEERAHHGKLRRLMDRMAGGAR